MTPAFERHIKLLLDSYLALSKKKLIEGLPDQANKLFKAVYQADFVLVSHGIEADPIVNFANLTAQKLWEMSLEEICKLPSRYTAEEGERAQRERFLKEVNENGFTDSYTGIRISKSGRRFFIKDAKVWNVYDETGKKYGKAAFFDKWEYL